MMKRLFAGRFIRSIGYLLSVHLVALLFFFGLRVALFIATDYDFPKENIGRLCLAKRGVPARPLVRQRHRLLHPAAAVGGILDSRMVRLHRPLALPLLCVLLHLFLFAVFHHFRSQYPLFRLLLQAHQFLHIQLVRLRGHHGGNGIRRNVLLPSHRLGTDSHRGFCLHHPPAVAHVLPFKPERRAPGKQMESRRLYVCDRNRPYRLVLFSASADGGVITP